MGKTVFDPRFCAKFILSHNMVYQINKIYAKPEFLCISFSLCHLAGLKIAKPN